MDVNFDKFLEESDSILKDIEKINSMEISDEAKKLPIKELKEQLKDVANRMHSYVDVLCGMENEPQYGVVTTYDFSDDIEVVSASSLDKAREFMATDFQKELNSDKENGYEIVTKDTILAEDSASLTSVGPSSGTVGTTSWKIVEIRKVAELKDSSDNEK